MKCTCQASLIAHQLQVLSFSTDCSPPTENSLRVITMWFGDTECNIQSLMSCNNGVVPHCHGLSFHKVNFSNNERFFLANPFFFASFILFSVSEVLAIIRLRTRGNLEVWRCYYIMLFSMWNPLKSSHYSTLHFLKGSYCILRISMDCYSLSFNSTWVCPHKNISNITNQTWVNCMVFLLIKILFYALRRLSGVLEPMRY